MTLTAEEYFKQSTIHGVVYFSKKYHLVERLFWILVSIVSIILTTLLIVELAIKIKTTPIVNYLSDKPISVSEINFPAVTVCPGFYAEPRLLTYVQDTFLEKYDPSYEGKNYNNISGSLKEMFKDDFKYNLSYSDMFTKIENDEIKLEDLGLRLLKRLQLVDLISRRGLFQQKNFAVPTNDLYDIFTEFKNLHQDSPTGYYWYGILTATLSPVMTPIGLCYTFNMAFSNDTFFLDNVSRNFHYGNYKQNKYMRGIEGGFPTQTVSADRGLKLNLYIARENDYLVNVSEIKRKTLTEVDGHNLYIHDPFELPSNNSAEAPINSRTLVNIWIEPELYSIDASLMSLHPEERNCYLDDEMVLKHFKVYTKSNCEQECYSDLMFELCGCVEFFMIRNSSTRVCMASEKECFDRARDLFAIKNFSCGCLNPCKYIKYNIKTETHFGILDESKISSGRSNVMVRFKDNFYNQLIRKKQFDEVDFLSFIGGILGLFAGFSVLSFIEIIYWIINFLVSKVFKRSNKTHPELTSIKATSEKFNILSEYLAESSIHGFNYLTNTKRFQKLLWSIAFVISMINCGILVSEVNKKLPNNRVMSFDDNIKLIKNITFPAVTLNGDFSSYKGWGDYMYKVEYFEVLMDLNKTPELIIKHLCEHFFCGQSYGFTNYNKGTSYKQLMADLIPHYIKNSSKIDWFKGQFSSWNYKFKPMFSEVRTQRGYGFTFNLMAAKDVFNLEEVDTELHYSRNITMKYDQNQHAKIPESSYPLTIQTTSHSEFHLKLIKPSPLPDDYKHCFEASLLVHSPDLVPTFVPRSEIYEIRYGYVIDIEVTPEIIKTDENLKKLNPIDRECYFDGERKLKYFKIYTQKNCEIECYTSYINNQCNCSRLDQPYNNKKGLPQCKDQSEGYKQYSCEDILNSDMKTSQYFSPEKNCSCLQTCNSINYRLKYNTMRLSEDENVTYITVRMNSDDITLYRRYQQYNFSDEIAYVGGLLGLFAGISVLSIFEIFYFFTLRLIGNLWKKSKEDN